MDITRIINKVNAQVLKDQQRTNELMAWARKEQAKVHDPKARSYSVLAQLIKVD